MEKLKSITIIFLLAVGLFTPVAPAKTTSVLLQEGLYAEEIEGDLDSAIKIYEQVIGRAKEAQQAAAQATYRIGMCYLKKGQKDKAAEHFQNIILNFRSQKALVTKAEKQLDKIKPRAERIVEQAVMTISTCAEGDPRVTRALESLKGLDENVVVNELVKFLDSETDTVRRSTIYILWRGNLSDISAAVPVLEKLCSHKKELTRGMAALALGQAKVNSSFDTLCDMTLKDNSGYARRCGAIALGWMGRADAKPILEKVLEDPDPLVCNNAKAALAMLPEKVRPLTRVFEPQALDEQVKSGEVPSFKVQLIDNTALDLDSGEISMLKDEWPDRFDVAWDNDGGGALMKKVGSGVRFLALPSGDKQMWDEAIYMARSDIDELRNSNTRGIWASQGKFAAVLTGEGNLAVIQIGEYDAEKGTIYGWIEKIPSGISSAWDTAEAFLAAAVSGRDSEAIKLVKPGSAVALQVKDFQEIAEKDKVKVVSVFGDEQVAVATTTEISAAATTKETSVEDKGPMLIRLIKQRGMWMVEDVDLETPASLKAEIDSFLQKHPNARKLQEPDVRGLSVSPHRRLLDERTLTAINSQDQFGAKWFKVEREYEAASQEQKQQMIEKWMADAQKPDVTIRSSAIASLGNICCKQAADILIKIAKEPMEFSRSNRPRWIAVRSLGRVGDMRAVPVLIDLLDHYNKDTQLYARVALCEITGVYFGSDKTKWQDWWKQKGKSTAELDLSTPEATIKSFVKAVYDGNLEAAKACVSKEGADYDEFMEMLATESNHPFQAMIKAMDASIPVEITSKDITEDRCKIKWYFTLGRVYYFGETKMKKGTPQEFSSYLELVGDKWLIRDI
ncbi:MAG: HEAT repeat domain-containing protein [Phycisphaerae bacterium]|nr:HEAT repeat domain-containing protein [Phycisphaerae bacterium]